MKIISSALSQQELQSLKKLLFERAEKRHGRIIPCGSWDKCFTMEDDKLLFWYTTPLDQSTHLVSQNLCKRDGLSFSPKKITLLEPPTQ